jgi:hypothetical protein
MVCKDREKVKRQKGEGDLKKQTQFARLGGKIRNTKPGDPGFPLSRE